MRLMCASRPRRYLDGVIFGIVASQDRANGTRSLARGNPAGLPPSDLVEPASLKLAPLSKPDRAGHGNDSGRVGDAAGSIVGQFFRRCPRIQYVGVEHNTIPVPLRSLDRSVGWRPLHRCSRRGATGRDNGEGQENFYEFDVDPGHSSVMANRGSAQNDPTNPVGLYLVNPYGVAVGYGQNSDSATGAQAPVRYCLRTEPGTRALDADRGFRRTRSPATRSPNRSGAI